MHGPVREFAGMIVFFVFVFVALEDGWWEGTTGCDENVSNGGKGMHSISGM